MLVDGALVAAGRLQMLADIALRQDVEPLDDAERDRLGCRSDEGEMEGAVEGADAFAMGVGDAVERFQRLAGDRLLIFLRPLGGQRHRLRLQLQPQGVDLLRLLGREGADEEASVRLGSDQPLLLEPRQRLAQRDLADAQLGGQRVLADGKVGADFAGKDAVAHQLDELVGQIADDNAAHEAIITLFDSLSS